LTDQEISNLQALEKNYQQIFNELGKISIKIETLNTEKGKYLAAYNELLKQQENIVKTIKDKYGEVQINLNTFEIIEP
jgi:archaellum component FlaC